MIAAFSRSSSPMRPISLESVTSRSGIRSGDVADLRLLQARDLAAVEVVAPAHEVRVVADRRAQVGRPRDHRRKGPRRRQREPDRGRLEQALPLDHRVREVRRPDHHGADRRPLRTGVGEHVLERREDPAADVRGRRRLVPRDDPRPVHEDRVGVRPADVDADPHRPTAARPASSSTGTKSRS
jgi:hypothetical protein